MNPDKIVEKTVENELLLDLESFGIEARHAIIDWPGFPDIIAIGKRIVLIEMKYDRKKEGSLIYEIMESSQPVFIHNVKKAGFDHIFICVYHMGKFYLYSPNDILMASMKDLKINQLPCVMKGSSIDIAGFIRSVCSEKL